jgi:ZIP family zinc transporter
MNDQIPHRISISETQYLHDRILWQHWMTAAVLLAGLAVLFAVTYSFLSSHNLKAAGALQGGTIAALATLAGTLPVLVSRQFSQRMQDTLLGFGAGVMLAASAFSLVIPGLEAARSQGADAWTAGIIIGTGILMGAAMLFLFDYLVPHQHFVKGIEGLHARRLKQAWLFVGAVTLHNLPEGLAIGVAFAGPNAVGAHALATGIALQNIPEGLVVALSLRAVGYSRLFSAGLGAASGLIEPVSAVLGAFLIGISIGLLPWGLAIAAGAMLYVISNEIIPESHRRGHEPFATWGLMFGFVLMMLLDTALA